MSFFSKKQLLAKNNDQEARAIFSQHTHKELKPPLWLLVMIIGLPLLSETVYTPSLVAVAHALNTTHAGVEYTLSIYLAAFACGTLFWGCISDGYGRKKPLVLGLFIYAFGSLLCAVSSSLEMLLVARFVQAFGGSTGSILGQVICRDVFQGKERGVIFSSLGAILSVAPAIGPVCGGILAESVGWRGMFFMLFSLGIVTTVSSLLFLFETHPNLALANSRPFSMICTVFKQLIRDPKVLVFGAVIGGMNGIMFSYYGEGAFYLMEQLSLRPVFYGLTFIFLSMASILGSLFSKKLLKGSFSSEKVIFFGLCMAFLAMFLFLSSAVLGWIHPLNPVMGIIITLISMCLLYFGMDTAKPSLLSHALDDYQHVSGTASSLFGCYYYGVISLMTVVMAYIRSNDMIRMPLYFLSMTMVMMFLFCFLRKKTVSAS